MNKVSMGLKKVKKLAFKAYTIREHVKFQRKYHLFDKNNQKLKNKQIA